MRWMLSHLGEAQPQNIERQRCDDGKGWVCRKGLSAKEKTATHNFFALFNAGLDLRNVPCRVVVKELFDFIFAKHGEILLCRELALTKARTVGPLRHVLQS